MFFRLVQIFRLGLKSLLLHKLRSGLAILGILIGVTAVIWLVAMGEGVSYQAQQQIKELGATNIIVRSIKPTEDSSRTPGGLFFQYGLLREDYDRIKANIPTIIQAVPLREIHKDARYLDRVSDVRLVGCTPQYPAMNNLHMAAGRFLSDGDAKRLENFCVIGDTTAETLFPYEDPIGKKIQVDNDFYVVVGRTANRSASGSIGGSFSGQDYNQDVYIPLSTLRARIGDKVFTSRSGSQEGEIVELSQITVTVGDISQVDETADMIKVLLEQYHKNMDYSIIVPKELLRQAEVMQMMFNLLLVLISGIRCWSAGSES